MESYKKKVNELPADAPPLSTVPFLNDNVGFVVRYYKGSLTLNRLRETLGDEKFFSACQDFFQTYKGQSIGTKEFRTFWKARLGDQGKLVDALLDAKGAKVP